MQAANLMLTYYKNLRLYTSPNTAWCSVEYADLNDSARNPYWLENNDEKKNGHLL
jgi:hypothetical protein